MCTRCTPCRFRDSASRAASRRVSSSTTTSAAPDASVPNTSWMLTPLAGRLFGALLRSGLGLGEIMAEVNGVIAADRASMGRLVLFGDAGLVPVPTAGSALEVQAGLDIPAGPGAVLVQ